MRCLTRALWMAPWFLFATILGGCSDGGDPLGVVGEPAVATRIEFTEPEVTLFIPSTTSVAVLVRDQRGNVLLAPVVLVSRDASTARVEGANTLVAVAPGGTWLVASAGQAVDSARVVVRYEVLVGEARVRLRTSRGDDLVRGWQSDAVLMDVLGGEERDRFLAVAANARGDTGIVVMLPALPAQGTRELAPTSLHEMLSVSDPTALGEFAYVLMGEEANALRIYVSAPGSRLVVDDVGGATGFGKEGIVRARLAFLGVGYLVVFPSGDGDPVVQETGDTLLAHVDLAPSYFWEPLGHASWTVTGGPAAGSAVGAWAEWSGGLYGVPDAGMVDASEDGMGLSVFLENPRVGALTLREPSAFGGLTFPSVRVFQYGSSGYTRGESVSGSVTLSMVVKPTDQTWGEIVGQVDATMAFQIGYGGDAVPADLTAAFHVPVEPTGGWRAPQLKARPGELGIRSLVRMVSER